MRTIGVKEAIVRYTTIDHLSIYNTIYFHSLANILLILAC